MKKSRNEKAAKMKTGTLSGLRKAIWCTVILIVLVSMASLTESATVVAQGEESTKETQKQRENTEPQKAGLRIRVLLVDPTKKQSPQPLANAMVKIKGEEDSYETGEDGKTPTLIILPGEIPVVIKPIGADPCIVNISVKEGTRIVTVLVEILPKVKCTLQP
jgi:hypothetical protein